MKRYRIIEILCLVIAIAFIAFTVISNGETNKTATEFTEILLPYFQDNTLVCRGIGNLRKAFGFDSDMFDSFSYYTSDDVMDVNEVLILILKDNSSSNKVCESIKEYVTERYNIFNGYAPDQALLLNQYILKSKGNAVIFIVNKNANEILDTFLKEF